MGLFFDVLSAINNPDQQGNIDQLATVTNTIQQAAAGYDINSSQLQGILSALGGALAPVLRQQSGSQFGSIVEQMTGVGASASAIQSLIPPQLLQQLIQVISQNTGVPSSTLEGLLPTLLPAVMSLLNMGASKSGTGGTNSVLAAFLDSNHDGNTDLGDVIAFSTRFLNPPR